MTPLLQQAFDTAAMLPEQDAIARWLLDELHDEDAFDAKIQATAHKLDGLLQAALTEHRAGKLYSHAIPVSELHVV